MTEFRAPERHRELTVLGFPVELGVGEYVSPLLFRARASSALLELTIPSFHNTFFVLEDPSIGGYSGAPVFDVGIYRDSHGMTSGDQTLFYGLMVGTIADATGGKLAIVVPSKFVVGFWQDSGREWMTPA